MEHAMIVQIFHLLPFFLFRDCSLSFSMSALWLLARIGFHRESQSGNGRLKSSDPIIDRLSLKACLLHSLDAYGKLMNDCASLLIDRLHAAAASSTEIDIWQIMGDMTMDVIGTAAFG